MNYEIIVNEADETSIPMRNMDVGEIARLEHSTYGGYLLRSYNEFILLNDPSKTWDKTCSAFYVKRLPPGTKITLKIN